MHVGLNLIYLLPGETGGTETYARELIPELQRSAPELRLTAFINRETERSRRTLGWLDDVTTITVPVQATRRVEWVRGEQQILPRLAARQEVDIVHSLANTGPAWGAFKRIVTIHDIHFRLVPEAHTPLMRLGMGVLVPLAARRSHRIITDARSTVGELQEQLGVASSKVDPIPLGIGNLARALPLPEAELRVRFGLGERPIVLCVASKRPHKNLARLISAVALIPAERRPVLVIPGYPTPHEHDLRAHAAALGVEADVDLRSWVSAEELEGLYAASTCLACPSLHEGFGLPVLEAMARGLPVACSGRGALAEVAGDAAVLFDPLAPDAIAAAIERILGDPDLAARLGVAGRARASGFTWRTTADRTVQTYRSVLSTVEPAQDSQAGHA